MSGDTGGFGTYGSPTYGTQATDAPIGTPAPAPAPPTLLPRSPVGVLAFGPRRTLGPTGTQPFGPHFGPPASAAAGAAPAASFGGLSTFMALGLVALVLLASKKV